MTTPSNSEAAHYHFTLSNALHLLPLPLSLSLFLSPFVSLYLFSPSSFPTHTYWHSCYNNTYTPATTSATTTSLTPTTTTTIPYLNITTFLTLAIFTLLLRYYCFAYVPLVLFLPYPSSPYHPSCCPNLILPYYTFAKSLACSMFFFIRLGLMPFKR